jgi:hypothetical protein
LEQAFSGFSQASSFDRVSAAGAGYFKQNANNQKKKLIDIGLSTEFSGYWKLFNGRYSSDIGSFRSLIPVNQLETKVEVYK